MLAQAALWQIILDMKPWMFKVFRSKDKDPDIYRVKILLFVIYRLLVKKGIITRQEFSSAIKRAEVDVGPNPRKIMSQRRIK